MNVYVETNFVLELALRQEQWESCQEILELSRDGHCRLTIPALALAEPYGAILRKKKVRDRLGRELRDHLSDIARSEPSRHLKNTFQSLSDGLHATALFEESNLYSVSRDLLSSAVVLPLTQEILDLGLDYRSAFNLAAEDAIMLATVTSHAREVRTRGIFVNRNTKDFDNPDIASVLGSHDCLFVSSFEAGVGMIRQNPEMGDPKVSGQ